MSRKKAPPIDPEPGHRLDILKKEFNIPYAELGRIMGYGDEPSADIKKVRYNAVSRIVSGQVEFKEDKAKLALDYINSMIPEKKNHISIDWLMNRTDFDKRTIEEAQDDLFRQWFCQYADDTEDYYMECMKEIINRAYMNVQMDMVDIPTLLDVMQEAISKMPSMVSDAQMANILQECTETPQTFDALHLSKEDFKVLSDKISDYAELIIKKFIEEKGIRNIPSLFWEAERRTAIKEQQLTDT